MKSAIALLLIGLTCAANAQFELLQSPEFVMNALQLQADQFLSSPNITPALEERIGQIMSEAEINIKTCDFSNPSAQWQLGMCVARKLSKTASAFRMIDMELRQADPKNKA